MTVCVAALCAESVIGISDRMITAGDIQYEPQQSKAVRLTSSIVAMYSGDTSIQTEVLNEVLRRVTELIDLDPSVWVKVRDAARIYSECFQAARRLRAERDILGPIGLNCESFLAHMNNMGSDVVQKLIRELAEYRFVEPHSALIVGVDADGFQSPGQPTITYGHIYLAIDAEMTCQDRVGFAAIGIGASHAESQFMFAGYNKSWTFPKALLLAHAAKKRAEASPGVGKATDMFSIGPALGSYSQIYDHVLKELDDNYKQRQAKMRQAEIKSEKRMMAFDKQFSKTGRPQQSQADPAPPESHNTVASSS